MEKTKRNEVKERIYSALSSTGSTWLTTAETTKICEDYQWILSKHWQKN